MFETLLNYRLVWDTIDILIVAIILYYILSIIEGTRAVQILFGLSIVFLLYFLSQSGGLFTINWILGHFLGSIIIIIVILFQSDIRKALASIGRKPLLIQLNKNLSEEYVVEEVVKSTSYLSSTKTGAIIALERNSSLNDFVELGLLLDAHVTRELIISIFNVNSPLHDGAIIIRGNNILSAGSFFPLETDPDVGRELGTRHRAALGLSNETDAIVVVVSEETGSVSLALEGELIRGLDASSLSITLMDHLGLKKKRVDIKEYISNKLSKVKNLI